MWMMKNHTLLPSAFQKPFDQLGSPNSVRKLSSPTKVWSPDTLRNSENCNVPNSGTIMIAV
jgi:hypothetical protein